MPAAMDVVLTDGEATPVDHTFNPARITDGYALFENRAGGIYVGYEKYSTGIRRPGPKADGSRNLKPWMKLELPVLKETSTGSTVSGYTAGPEVDYRLVAEITFTLPDKCTEQERKNLRLMIKDAMGQSCCIDLVEKYDPVY